ncbi:hypothetical protein B0H11DRAFT_2254627 [Mycena galericulata]|nr:hypothetical protein B0H11DRAFT_2254627 [Mycena galericulata]
MRTRVSRRGQIQSTVKDEHDFSTLAARVIVISLRDRKEKRDEDPRRMSQGCARHCPTRHATLDTPPCRAPSACQRAEERDIEEPRVLFETRASTLASPQLDPRRMTLALEAVSSTSLQTRRRRKNASKKWEDDETRVAPKLHLHLHPHPPRFAPGRKETVRPSRAPRRHHYAADGATARGAHGRRAGDEAEVGRAIIADSAQEGGQLEEDDERVTEEDGRTTTRKRGREAFGTAMCASAGVMSAGLAHLRESACMTISGFGIRLDSTLDARSTTLAQRCLTRALDPGRSTLVSSNGAQTAGCEGGREGEGGSQTQLCPDTRHDTRCNITAVIHPHPPRQLRTEGGKVYPHVTSAALGRNDTESEGTSWRRRMQR